VKIARLTVFGLLCLSMLLTAGLPCLAQEDADEDFGEMELVIEFLNDPDPETRSIGLDLVRDELKGEEATKQLVGLLPEMSDEAKVGLISALADRGDKAARSAILQLLTSDSAEPIRVAAFQALGFLGEAADVNLLIETLTGSSEPEVKAARASLVDLKGEGVSAAIVDKMNQAGPTMQITLIKILTDRRALDTVSDILALALSDEQAVRLASMQSLKELASPEHVEGMVQGILREERGKARDAAEKALAVVCGRTEDPTKRAEPLLAAYEKRNKADQQTLLSAMGRVGGPDVLKIVEAAIASSDAKIHGLGIRAICNWPDATIVPRLTELATGDAHDSHKTSALRALIRVAPLRDGRSATERLELLSKTMEMATADRERHLVLDKARSVLDVQTLDFLLPYLDQPAHREAACLAIVELAHNVPVREPNKERFHEVLDRVIALAKDPVVIERAQLYKENKTWYRPAKTAPKLKPQPAPTAVTEQPTEEKSQPADAVSDAPDAGEPEIEMEPKSSMWLFAAIGLVFVLGLLALGLSSRR